MHNEVDGERQAGGDAEHAELRHAAAFDVGAEWPPGPRAAALHEARWARSAATDSTASVAVGEKCEWSDATSRAVVSSSSESDSSPSTPRPTAHRAESSRMENEAGKDATVASTEMSIALSAARAEGDTSTLRSSIVVKVTSS